MKSQTIFEKFEDFDHRSSKSFKSKRENSNQLEEDLNKQRKASNGALKSVGDGQNKSSNSQYSQGQNKSNKVAPKKNKTNRKIKSKSQNESLLKERDDDEPYIGDVQFVDKHMIDNEYICRGYRIGFNSTKKLLRSLFMIHNESVNVWSHLLGTIFFFGLIVYTSYYCAPPSLYAKPGDFSQRWFGNINETSAKNQALLSNLLNSYKSAMNQTSADLGSLNFTNATDLLNMSSFEQELLKEALQAEQLGSIHSEAKSQTNHPEASVFETMELYLSHAIHAIADPQLYVGCVDSLQSFTKVLKNLPSHLQEQLTSTIQEIKDIDIYQHKLDYLKNLINYLETRVDQWADDINDYVNSPDFDFLELKPIFAEPHQYVNYITRFPLFIHMIGAICCLGCSAFYHLFKDHSEHVNRTLVRADYAGISLMIAGSNTPPIFYSFYCEEMHGWRYVYLCLMYFFCFSSFVVLLVPKFDQPRFRVLRGSLFVICGLLSVIPITHIEFFTDLKYLQDFQTFPWALGGALYIGGAVMYMLKVPERFKPGFFDIIGSSHQLFHFLIVTAALVHYRASINIFHDRQLYQCPVKALENFIPK